jgi:hypothetical protein
MGRVCVGADNSKMRAVLWWDACANMVVCQSMVVCGRWVVGTGHRQSLLMRSLHFRRTCLTPQGNRPMNRHAQSLYLRARAPPTRAGQGPSRCSAPSSSARVLSVVPASSGIIPGRRTARRSATVAHPAAQSSSRVANFSSCSGAPARKHLMAGRRGGGAAGQTDSYMPPVPVLDLLFTTRRVPSSASGPRRCRSGCALPRLGSTGHGGEVIPQTTPVDSERLAQLPLLPRLFIDVQHTSA